MNQPPGLQRDLLKCSRETRLWVLTTIADLQAIVDKYPKTADGVVITDKMPCYFPIANGALCFYANLSPQSEPIETYPWDKGYSTLELAEASRDD